MANNRYDMPVLFGPSPMPERTHVPRAEAVIVPFETTAEAARRLLPRFFTVRERPIVTVSRIDYHDVDYLGGRSYREVVVSVSASFEQAGARIDAAFAPVLWVTEVAALIGGREYMGLAKLPAEMMPVDATPDTRHFSCSEYGAELLHGDVTRLEPLADEKLQRVNAASADVLTFGWKYIPGADVSPDADHPLVNRMSWRYERAWSGEGRVVFGAPDAKAAPLSSRVLTVLREIPVVAWRRAFVGEGSAVIDRAATRRLQAQVAQPGEYGVAL